MGISPISGLMPLPMRRPIDADLGLPPMEKIESSYRTGDETYSPSDGRSADESDDEFENLADEDATPAARASEEVPSRQISFFA